MEEKFASRLLPLFKRRTEEVGALLPELYLHGLSLGDFDSSVELALRGLQGDGAPLSASSIARLKAEWQHQYTEWKRRDLWPKNAKYGLILPGGSRLKMIHLLPAHTGKASACSA